MMITALLCLALTDAETGKVESVKIGPEIAPEAAKGFRPEGVRVLDGTSTVATVWWSLEVTHDALPEQAANGLTWREFKPGTVLGVIAFPQAFTDSRRQGVAAGTYTLRLGFQPETGDHKGTAPHGEFALLCRWEDDNKLEALEMKDLVERSAKVGGTHPAVMLLFPNTKPAAGPKLAANGERWLALEDVLAVAGKGAKPIGVSLVVRGSSEKSPE